MFQEGDVGSPSDRNFKLLEFVELNIVSYQGGQLMFARRHLRNVFKDHI